MLTSTEDIVSQSETEKQDKYQISEKKFYNLSDIDLKFSNAADFEIKFYNASDFGLKKTNALDFELHFYRHVRY